MKNQQTIKRGRPRGTSYTPQNYLTRYPHVVEMLRAGHTQQATALACDVGTGTVLSVAHALRALATVCPTCGKPH